MKKILFFALPLPLLAILNGAFRELFLKEYFNELTAHQLSVLSIGVIFLLYGLIIKPWIRLDTRYKVWLCSFTWVTFAILFELIMGHVVMGLPYKKLLEDYNVLEGRLWPVVLLFLGFLPFIIRNRKSAS